jgi:hypothetical protein
MTADTQDIHRGIDTTPKRNIVKIQAHCISCTSLCKIFFLLIYVPGERRKKSDYIKTILNAVRFSAKVEISENL